MRKKLLSTKGTGSAVPLQNRMDEGFSPWGARLWHSSCSVARKRHL